MTRLVGGNGDRLIQTHSYLAFGSPFAPWFLIWWVSWELETSIGVLTKVSLPTSSAYPGGHNYHVPLTSLQRGGQLCKFSHYVFIHPLLSIHFNYQSNPFLVNPSLTNSPLFSYPRNLIRPPHEPLGLVDIFEALEGMILTSSIDRLDHMLCTTRTPFAL